MLVRGRRPWFTVVGWFFFLGTDRLLTRPKGAHTRPLTSHRLDPVGRHRDNPANGTKTQSHSTVGTASAPRAAGWADLRLGSGCDIGGRRSTCHLPSRHSGTVCVGVLCLGRCALHVVQLPSPDLAELRDDKPRGLGSELQKQARERAFEL